MAIQKDANCLRNIAVDLISVSFEFRAYILTLTDQLMYLFYRQGGVSLKSFVTSKQKNHI